MKKTFKNILEKIKEFFKKKPAKIKKIRKEKIHKEKLPKEKKAKKHSILKIILIVVFSIGILSLIGTSLFFVWIGKTAGEFNPEALYQQEATILYDKDGEIIAKLGVEKRENVSYDEVPEVLINAVVATEDSRFFSHNGFDLPRFVKASLGQFLGQSSAGGASTISMQLSKNVYTSTNDSGFEGIIRKFKDIYMAIFKIEKNYTKQEILEFYLNYNYLGGESRGGAYGVEQACQIYFGKSVSEINLSEAALIAGLFQSPGALDPLKYPEKATERRSTVLYLMQLHGYITAEEREIAEAISVESLLSKNYETNSYQGFIDTVVEEVKEKTGLDPYTTAMEIYTTMDASKQAYIDAIMKGETYSWENVAVQAGAVVLNNATGEILAVGANRDLVSQKAYNYATMIKRQIGSTAKPLYDYGPAIEYYNYSTYTLYADEPYSYTNGPNINNWDGEFQGLITMRTALAQSRNIPALKTFKAIPNKDIKTFATNLGLNPEMEGGYVHEAHAIGAYTGESPLSVAGAYAAYGNKGVYNTPHSFTKVVFRTSGEIYENKVESVKVMGEDTAYMVTSILYEGRSFALGYWYQNINKAQIAAKSGTTNYPEALVKQYNLPDTTIKDKWLVTYDPTYTIALWYGYDQLNSEYAANGYYTSIYTSANKELMYKIGLGVYDDSARFQQPANVKSITVERETNPAKLPSEFTPDSMKVVELFKEGTEPAEVSNRYSKLNNVSNVASSISSNKITLSWDAIETPDAINEEKIQAFVNSLFTDSAYASGYFNSRIIYNESSIGKVSYNVYIKNGTTLTLLKNTEETSYTYTIEEESDTITFVIKTVYTIFKDNISDGATLEVDLDGINIVSIRLTNAATINLSIGGTYENNNPVTVLENGTNKTTDATVLKTIKDKDNNVVSAVTTSAANIFTITYIVTYEDSEEVVHNKTLTQTVNVSSE